MAYLERNAVSQYVLSKQHLLEGTQIESVLRVVENIVALHATSATTPYLSLLARTKDFKKENLEESLYRKRELIRIRGMRGTLFVTCVNLAPVLHQALAPRLQSWAPRWGVSQAEHDELGRAVRDFLTSGGKTLSEIRKALPRHLLRAVEAKEGRNVYKTSNLNVVLNAMVRDGRVLSEKGERSTGTNLTNRYALLSMSYPDLDLNSVTAENARARLVKEYIKTFGPVTESDIAWWTGFKKAELREILRRIEGELISVKISGMEYDYFMLKADYESFKSFRSVNTDSLSVLPYEDPYIKGYKHRERLVAAEHEKEVYVGGEALPSILLNGMIVGTWNRSIEWGKGPIIVRFLREVTDEVREKVVQKAKVIGGLMAKGEVDIRIEK